MSKVLVTDTHLEDIADAIREKLGVATTYRPGDMATAIQAIPTGGGATLVPKAVTQNGEYDPEDDNADGYSYVTVNVSGGGGGSTNILSGTEEPTAAQGSNGDIFLHYIGAGTLPSGYTAHQFIQSSGTQFIDTGVPARVQLKVEIDCCWLSSGDQTVIGGSSNINTNAIYLGYNSSNGRTYVGYAGSWHDFTSSAVDTNRHKWEIDLQTGTQTMTVDGNVFATTSNTFTETTAAGNLFLFGRSNGGSMFIGQIFRVKIYDYLDSGNLIRDFVPAVRDSDGAVGMYDTVNDVFYTNAGTGEFTTNDDNGEIIAAYAKNSGAWQNLIGTDIDDVDTSGSINLQSKTATENGTVTPDSGYDGLSSVVVNVQGGGGEDPFLLTDYIESNGTQYINTGYAVTTGTRIEIVANVPDNGTSYPALFGARNNTGDEVVIFVEFNGGNIAMVWANGDTGFAPVFWERGYIGKKCEYILGQNGVTEIRDKDNYGFKGTRTTGTGTSQPLYIFALNENGSPNGATFCAAKLYRMRIYENDTLVHEYVPWTDSNNVVCLKDTVSSNLLYNAGTGVFVRGSDT